MTDDKLRPTQADIDLVAELFDAIGNQAAAFVIRQCGLSGTVHNSLAEMVARHRIAATDTQVSKHSELAELRGIIATAQLPWRVDVCDVVRDDPNDEEPWTVAHCSPGEGMEEVIVKAVNAIPALLAHITALRQAPDAQVSRLVSALERIAQIDSDGLESHTPQAMVSIARKALSNIDSDPPCTDCNDTGYNPNTERQCTCSAALDGVGSK